MSLREAFDEVHASFDVLVGMLEDLRVSIAQLENQVIQTEYEWRPDHPVQGEMLVEEVSTDDARKYLVHFHKDADALELAEAKKRVEENFK